jgi:hypothetical protein
MMRLTSIFAAAMLLGVCAMAQAQLVEQSQTHILTAAEIGAMPPVELSRFTSEQLRNASPDQALAVTHDQREWLVADQQKALYSSIPASQLPADVARDIVRAQQRDDGYDQKAAGWAEDRLAKEGLPGLIPDEVHNLPPEKLAKLSPKQLAKISPEQMAVLTSAQLSKLSEKQFEAIYGRADRRRKGSAPVAASKATPVKLVSPDIAATANTTPAAAPLSEQDRIAIRFAMFFALSAIAACAAVRQRRMKKAARLEREVEEQTRKEQTERAHAEWKQREEARKSRKREETLRAQLEREREQEREEQMRKDREFKERRERECEERERLKREREHEHARRQAEREQARQKPEPRGSHYDNLKVLRTADPEVIKAAYKALVQKWHPDRNKHPNATRNMAIINEAYAVLSDPIKRAAHDEWLTTP